MAYATTNPPKLIGGGLVRAAVTDATGGTQGASGHGSQMWIYVSTDVSTVVDGDGFFTDGYNLGMRRGDTVFVVERVSGSTTTLTTIHNVSRATATGGVDLADGTTVGATTDSD